MDEPLGAPPSYDIAEIRAAILLHFSGQRNLLGSRLGVVVRSKFSSPAELKGRHGGLKAFVGEHLGDLVHWRGRRGLDDLYDIGEASDAQTLPAWNLVEARPSPGLWSAVSNPSIPVQFSLGDDRRTIYQASSESPAHERFAAIAKISRQDYEEFAMSYLRSLTHLEPSAREEALAVVKSSLDFNRWIREHRLLPQWEAFRVQQVITTFVSRLAAAGADDSFQEEWRKAIEESHQLVRRSRESISLGPIPEHRRPDIGSLDTRAVVSRALSFMDEDDVQSLRLPVGAVLRAIKSLR